MSRKRHGNKEKPPVQVREFGDVLANLPKESIKHSSSDGGHSTEHVGILELRTKKIMIGIPLDEVLFSQWFVNFEGLDKMPWDSLVTTVSTYLPDARNKIHDTFLLKDKSEHLLMLDSDVMPPPKLIASLLAHNKDCVGGWYRKKEKFPAEVDGKVQIIQRPVVYDQFDILNGLIRYKQKMFPGTGLEEVGAAGAGCWLMTRKLAEALGPSPYSMDQGGEDMVICRKITAAGYSMWIDWSLACAHIGTFFL